MARQKASAPIDTAAMLTVMDGATTVGFILSRGPRGYEAFDRDGKTLGLFASTLEASRALAKIPAGEGAS